jgi:hypothetical protein
MVASYDSALSTIGVHFSAEIGASPETIAFFIARLNGNPEWRNNLRQEIEASLIDPAMSWKEALWSEYCHVEEFQSEAEARDWIARHVLALIASPMQSGQSA